MAARGTSTSAATVVRPHPEAWAEAVRIVDAQDGDRRRIQVIDANNLVIRNSPVGQ